MARVTAVFADHAAADAAISVLRRRGVSDSNMSFVAKRVDDVEVGRRPEGTTAERVTKGAITGVGRGQTVVLVRAQEPGSSTFAEDSMLVVVAEPGAPVLISSVDRFNYGRDAAVTLSIFMDMRSETRALGSTGEMSAA